MSARPTAAPAVRTSASVPHLPALRACELCDHHHVDAGGVLHCTCPRVAGTGRQVSCESARRRYGGCGPDAEHMQWAALDVPSLRPALPCWPTPATR